MSTPPPPDFDLVPLAARHKDATLRWMNDPALMPMLNRLHVITPAEHDTWFAALPGRKDLACFAIETGRPRHHAGNIWLHAIDPVHRKAEVRIMLDPTAHDHGLGSAAIARLEDHAFGQLRLNRLYACVLAGNPRARRAFEKAGYSLEATLRQDRWDGGKFVDSLVLAKAGKFVEFT